MGSDVAFPVPQFPRLRNKNVKIADLLGFYFSNAVNFDYLRTHPFFGLLLYFLLRLALICWMHGVLNAWFLSFFFGPCLAKCVHYFWYSLRC